MIKIKSISLGFACSLLVSTSAFAGLPTIDFGNIAGTVGIVTQGSTSIQQGISIITNGADLNSIIGDSAGSLMKFLPGGLGGEGGDGQSLKDALKRINDGVSSFNKVQEEIKGKKEEYQALMDSVGIKKEDSSEAYDDGESEGSEYGADEYYDAYSEPDYDVNNVSTQQIVNKGAMLTADGKLEPVTADESVPLSLEQAPEMRKMPVEPQMAIQEMQINAQELTGAPEGDMAEAVELKPGNELKSPVNGLGRQAFGKATSVEKADTLRTIEPSAEKMKIKKSLPAKAELTEGVVAKTPTLSAPEKVSTGNVVAPKAEVPVVQPATQGKFRVSPKAASIKTDKLSSNTKSFSARLMFAAKKSSNTKGANTDAYGNFISALPKRCGVSIDDLSDEEKLKECLNKVISENNASNQFEAALSRKQCQRMVYDTVVALMAEATLAKTEASSYKDTLDEQESLGGDSNNTRDDSSVLAMSNEQIQKLLNKMSLLTSSQILLDTITQLCSMQGDVVEDNSDSGDNDGEE